MKLKRKDWDSCLHKNVLLEIYLKSRNSSFFSLGYMIAKIGKFYIFKTITEYGDLDGYVLYRKYGIEKIKTADNYTKVFNNYINLLQNDNHFDNLDLENLYNKIPIGSINSIVRYCYDHNLVVTIDDFYCDCLLTGTIKSFNRQELVLDQEEYCKDYDVNNDEKIVTVKLNNISGFDLVTQKTYLYQQYLRQK
ncbi:hypothetical protein [Lactobacillus panisapium]|uniref:Uncharacterized protein n=1 Tax=Lactobacillus panisapium TaxID=2012495 RepID=A0ABX8W381_9LACO|nr:hypothetical protein [Lactobacillus panisapium]QYN51937.1 hypothetical protein GYM71_00190 [Lactobacillus panisapium]QYN57766.1 hypothetical protein GYM68_00140 [Lactobacillus panisapium]